jgi:hypothetical protein
MPSELHSAESVYHVAQLWRVTHVGKESEAVSTASGCVSGRLRSSQAFLSSVEGDPGSHFIHALVAEHYSSRGRPSIDLVVFFKLQLQLIMFFEDIGVWQRFVRNWAI